MSDGSDFSPTISPDPRLDRIPRFDDRSRQYAVENVLRAKPLRTRMWYCPRVLDQGREGACVGFSQAHFLIASPAGWRRINHKHAHEYYKEAQRNDEWAGENYSGSSVLGGMKAAKQAGRVIEYRWAFGIEDTLNALSQIGPVVLGVNWYQGFYQPIDGRITITGPVVGGHAILANGINVRNETVRLHNSWGLDWGKRGTTLISFSDLDRLLREQGEACVPTKAPQPVS